MLKFVCDNGTFNITNVRESRSFRNGELNRYVSISIDGETESIDDIEKILIDPEIVKDFKIETDGAINGEFVGYDLDGINRNIGDGAANIDITFNKNGK